MTTLVLHTMVSNMHFQSVNEKYGVRATQYKSRGQEREIDR